MGYAIISSAAFVDDADIAFVIDMQVDVRLKQPSSGTVQADRAFPPIFPRLQNCAICKNHLMDLCTISLLPCPAYNQA